MKLTILSDKLAGNRIEVPIYTSEGTILLNRGAQLTTKKIDHLKKNGINTVYIDDGSSDLELQETLHSQDRIKLTKALSEVFNNAKEHQTIDKKKIFEMAEYILSNINPSENAFMINNIAKNERENSVLENHCVDVAITVAIVGINNNFPQDKLIEIIVSALLHDIGKIFGDDKDHPKRGYDIVKGGYGFPTKVFIAIQQHHENEDGSGYPNGYKKDKISGYAKILNICNTYINLTDSNEDKLPNDIIETITADAVYKFDNIAYRMFMRSIYCYPNGLDVILNTGNHGKVVMQNKNYPLRPIVGVVGDNGSEFVDLLKEHTVFIEKIQL